MSQDLLSFLDEPGPTGKSGIASHQTNNAPGQTASEDTNSIGIHERSPGNATAADTAGPSLFDNGNDEDDDFGDFEDASLAPTEVNPPAPVPVPAPAMPQPKPEFSKSKPRAKEVRSPFPPKASKPPKPTTSPKSRPPAKRNDVGSHPFAGRMDLLFEADGDDYDAGTDELGDLANNPEAAMEYSKRIIAEQEEKAKGKGKGKNPAGQRGEFVDLEEVKSGSGVINGKGKAKDPNVLFDADDVSDDGGEGEDDDFGDFETWDASATSAPAQSENALEPLSSGMDLLGLDDAPPPNMTPKSAQTRTLPQQTMPGQTSGRQTASTSSSSATKQHDDDFWDDFETTTSASRKQHRPPSQPTQDDTWPDFDETPAPPSAKPTSSPSRHSNTKPPPQQDILPPTNIPPPLTLLTLFPPLFTSCSETLLTPLSKLDLASRQTLLAHPATHQFLRGYLSALKVLARIIAGRKLRWKRDQRLSQSMRIGPSVAGGGKGGMKLAGLDKSEVAKEDREVVDTIRLYRAQIGKLRSAVSSASTAPGLPKLPAVPEINSETIPVKALKQAEGGITAREACALCGLKREERVTKVDDAVEDSFGEWWVKERGMHVQCWEFWEGNERRLKSR